jgi:preprotein translocase subunit SecG
MGAYVVISVLIFIICILLVFVVLVQNSKGGGLASNFSSSNQFMGVRKTADFLEKTTWILAISLLVLSMASIFVIPRSTTKEGVDSELKQTMDNNKPVDYAPVPKK